MKIIMNETQISPESIGPIDLVLFQNHESDILSHALNEHNFKLYTFGYFNKDVFSSMTVEQGRQFVYDNEYIIFSEWDNIFDDLSNYYDIYLSTWMIEYLNEYKHYFVYEGRYNKIGSIKYIDQDETNVDYTDTLDIWLFGVRKGTPDDIHEKDINEILEHTSFVLFHCHEIYGCKNQSSILINPNEEEIIKEIIMKKFNIVYNEEVY